MGTVPLISTLGNFMQKVGGVKVKCWFDWFTQDKCVQEHNICDERE